MVDFLLLLLLQEVLHLVVVVVLAAAAAAAAAVVAAVAAAQLAVETAALDVFGDAQNGQAAAPAADDDDHHSADVDATVDASHFLASAPEPGSRSTAAGKSRTVTSQEAAGALLL